VAAIEQLAGAAFVVTTDAISRNASSKSTTRLADWADAAADNVARGGRVPPSPGLAASLPATEKEPGTGLSLRAIEQLESEVQRVASSAQ
jgi:hypothetical protein